MLFLLIVAVLTRSSSSSNYSSSTSGSSNNSIQFVFFVAADSAISVASAAIQVPATASIAVANDITVDDSDADISFKTLPQRFRRRPVTLEEIEYIEVAHLRLQDELSSLINSVLNNILNKHLCNIWYWCLM